jgi:hypothetical protein
VRESINGAQGREHRLGNRLNDKGDSDVIEPAVTDDVAKMASVPDQTEVFAYLAQQVQILWSGVNVVYFSLTQQNRD